MTTVVISTALAATVAGGGVLHSTIRTVPGSGPCFTIVAMFTGSKAVRITGFLFVASGISPVKQIEDLALLFHRVGF